MPPEEITDADVDRAFDSLRQRLADFENIEGRGLEMDDFAVIDYAGRLDGKPVNEVVPDAPKELAGKENFWIKLGPQTLLPGFSEALLGATAGETRDFGLDVPEDFPIEALKGKQLDYTVKVNELKRQDAARTRRRLRGKGRARQDPRRTARPRPRRTHQRAQRHSSRTPSASRSSPNSPARPSSSCPTTSCAARPGAS